MSVFKFRAHHLLCNLCFRGKGYNKTFVQNFKIIHEKLKAEPDKACIKIVKGMDDICTKCPEKKGNQCKHKQKVEKFDKAYLEILQLEIGEIISLNEIKNRIKNRVTFADFHRVCQKCSWYSLGICKPIIQKLITENEEQIHNKR